MLSLRLFRVVFLQREPPQCPPRPASYTPSSHNEPTTYSNTAAVALNNLDTLRSYGSAGDELENFPPDYLRNLNRSTPIPPPSITLTNTVGGNASGSDADSLHKPTWQEQMQLATYINDQTTKIKNGEWWLLFPAVGAVASYRFELACGMRFFLLFGSLLYLSLLRDELTKCRLSCSH